MTQPSTDRLSAETGDAVSERWGPSPEELERLALAAVGEPPLVVWVCSGRTEEAAVSLVHTRMREAGWMRAD